MEPERCFWSCAAPRFYALTNLPRLWVHSSLLKTRTVVLTGCLAFGAIATGLCASAAQPKTGSREVVTFNIPSQPLADALVAYGAATGLEVYYDGTLAVGRRSAALDGSFMPMHGLEILLDGTGFWPRATAPDSFTLISLQRAELPARLPESLLRQHEPFFSALQAGIAAALCDTDADQVKQIIFSFWITGTGAIYGARLLGSEQSASGARLVERVNKVNIGRPSPADVPQPITMAVYPPSGEGVSGCSPTAKPETDH